MPNPPKKKTYIFIDGQNLYKSCKEAFGYSYPNYNIKKLVDEICMPENLDIKEICFYTGVPEIADDEKWHLFWNNKLTSMGQQGIKTFRRALRYRNQRVKLPDGTDVVCMVKQEKGIDVRIAVDVIRTAMKGDCDVIIVFSQDQDLSEVADEVRLIAKEKNKFMRICSAYPFSPASKNKRGINKTDWIKIDRALYEKCIDSREFRPKPK